MTSNICGTETASPPSECACAYARWTGVRTLCHTGGIYLAWNLIRWVCGYALGLSPPGARLLNRSPGGILNRSEWVLHLTETLHHHLERKIG